MTKARDLANIISGGFTESDIPNLSASKITSGQFADARIADLNASKLTGSIADARVPASAVSQHATSFDDNKIVNDISTLGLRVHTQENLNASNSNSASFDVFQDSSAISNLTNTQRNASEYVSSVIDGGFATDTAGTLKTNLHNVHNFDNNTTDAHEGKMVLTNGPLAPTFSSSIKKFGTHSVYSAADNQGYTMNHNSVGHAGFGANESTSMSCWIYQTSDNANWNMIYDGISSDGNHGFIFAGRYSGQDDTGIYDGGGSGVGWANGGGTIVLNQWHHMVFMISSSKKEMYFDGVRQINASGSFQWNASHSSNCLFKRFDNGSNLHVNSYIDQLCFWKNKILSTTEIADLYNSGNGNEFSGETVSATGSFTGNNITASSTNKMGCVLTYQDNAGTNALNTDIVLQLSADGGSNFTTATMTALPDFATGIKMAKVNDLSVTAGTSLKYKISFANQASGSKEARIRGVSLQY